MRFLLTGGAGFIGSHMADLLVGRGDDVTALDDISTGTVDNVEELLPHPRFQLVEGSVLDADTVRPLVAEADVVVHLAAAVGVRLIIDQPLKSLLTNVRGTEVVLEACAALGRRVLITSTSEIYGKSAVQPLHEDADRVLGSPFVARWSYSTSKAVDEILAHAYWEDRNTPTIVARLFNCVGPRQRGEFGMVLPTFVRAALRGDPLIVHGTGEQRRSFCHVADTVAGLVSLLDHPDSPGRPYNVGAWNEVTIRRLAELVVERTDSSSPIQVVPYDEAYVRGFEDMERRLPDITRICDLTGWQPSRSLDDIVGDVIAFERSKSEAAA
ncbi:MAG TPA: GDP-mannose 4,6-dehydratase [Actinomycetota bacterium]|nr:GDP-mannose 4,6-dehydratase [Actinomycetota bacterium]